MREIRNMTQEEWRLLHANPLVLTGSQAERENQLADLARLLEKSAIVQFPLNRDSVNSCHWAAKEEK